jgi:hypothetical protein
LGFANGELSATLFTCAVECPLRFPVAVVAAHRAILRPTVVDAGFSSSEFFTTCLTLAFNSLTGRGVDPSALTGAVPTAAAVYIGRVHAERVSAVVTGAFDAGETFAVRLDVV